jgi:hypothetical protein
MLPEILDRTLTLIKNLMRNHWIAILVFCGVFCVGWLVIFSALTLYRSNLSRTITVLSDVAGSSSFRSAPKVVDKISAMSRAPGIEYKARRESIADADELENRIERDNEGRLIGFTVYRGHKIPGMGTLVPLDYAFLHVVCSHRFIVEHGLTPPYSIVTVLNLLTGSPDSSNGHTATAEPGATGRVFAGPPNGACRQLVESVYERCGYETVQMLTTLHHGLSDWDEARAALKTGEIDLMFYLGPPDASTIGNIATEDCCAALVGLDDIQDALVAEDEKMSLWKVSFPKNAYSSREFDVNGKKLCFCKEKLGSVAVRRLLVCSENVPPADAYRLAQAAKDALKPDIYMIGDWNALPTGVTESRPESNLKDTMQSGADTPPSELWYPSTWSPFWVSLAMTSIGAVILQTLRGLKWSRQPDDAGTQEAAGDAGKQPVDPSAAKTGESVFQQENRILQDQLNRLQSDELEPSAWAKEKRNIQAAQRRIRTLASKEKLTDDDAEQLQQIVKELDAALDPPQVPSSKTSTTESATSQGNGDATVVVPKLREPKSREGNKLRGGRKGSNRLK